MTRDKALPKASGSARASAPLRSPQALGQTLGQTRGQTRGQTLGQPRDRTLRKAVPPIGSTQVGSTRVGSAPVDSIWHAGTVILLLVFTYFWIGISPLAPPALADEVGDAALVIGANMLNQLVVVALSFTVIVKVWQSPARATLLSPHVLLLAILTWFCLVSLLASSPETAFRRIVFAILVCICANAVLLLPRDRREFTTVLAIIITTSLLLAYFVVLAMPYIGIHQSNETEALLAGSWRGHFGHKNAAAAAMAYIFLIGLYLRQASYRWLGTGIVILAGVFLYNAGGKTSAGMLPAVLIVAWLFERIAFLRYPMVLGSLVALNVLLIGAATSPPIYAFVDSLGIDATFTGRNSIWAFSLHEISQRPLVGYGFQAFWQSQEMVQGSAETMTFRASHSHNAFIETLINGGIPALLLVVPWLVVLPIRDAGRALAGGNDLALTRLFLRIWLFTMYLACLENVFFENSGPIWFSTLMAVFGLRLQARARLSQGARHSQPASSPASGPAPALHAKLSQR